MGIPRALSVRHRFPPCGCSEMPPILLSVPVTNVRLTDSAPTLDNVGFIMPMARLSIATSEGPKELEKMLRIHFLQQWFNLADD